MRTDQAHPYYPLDLELPGYVPMQLHFDYILTVFFAGVAAVFALLWVVAGTRKHLSTADRVVAAWFTVTGLIHLVIEGWVVAVPDFYKDTTGNLLSEIWKEYAKADSRYATRDPFIISMEAVTAFAWGPACLAITYGILAARPWRLPLMIVVSLGQIYGDVLYYATCWLEGFAHSRPEALYFWFYFVIVNSFWIIIPSAVILYATGKITMHALAHEEAQAKAKRA